MAYSVAQGGGSCALDQWAVIDDADGTTLGCHDSRSAADQQATALSTGETDPAAITGRMMAGRALAPAPAAPDTGRSSQTVRTTPTAPAGRVSQAPRQA